jgi:hypothetical protein
MKKPWLHDVHAVAEHVAHAAEYVEPVGVRRECREETAVY